MKKLFISLPMRDRTDEAIEESMRKMHKIAEATLGEELEVIKTHMNHDECPSNANHSVFCLGASIQLLAEADYCICVNDVHDYHGVRVEKLICDYYGIPMIYCQAEYVAPDAYEIENRNCFPA